MHSLGKGKGVRQGLFYSFLVIYIYRRGLYMGMVVSFIDIFFPFLFLIYPVYENIYRFIDYDE